MSEHIISVSFNFDAHLSVPGGRRIQKKAEERLADLAAEIQEHAARRAAEITMDAAEEAVRDE